MKVILVMLVVSLLALLRKPILLRFYLELAIGRTTGFLKFLGHILTGSKKPEPELEKEMEWLHRQKLLKVSTRSVDGTWLAGHYLRNPKEERIVLMFHGWRGSWDRDGAALAHGLYDKNCSILLAEQRAHGGSGGNYIGFGVLEREDCLAWVDDLLTRTEKSPVYLEGVSMGASTVLMAAGEKLPERVEGVIADCGFTSPYEMLKQFAVKFMHMDGEKLESTTEQVNCLCRKKAGYDLRGYSTLQAMESCTLPVFFVHGTGDGFVPCEMSVKNYETCVSRKEMYLVPGAAHTKAYLTNPQKYMDMVTEFFQWTPASAI